jgi:hypothetical protein
MMRGRTCPSMLPLWPTLRKAIFVTLLTQSASALPILSGTVRDNTKGPVDGAKITIWEAGNDKDLQTVSAMGHFALAE